MFTLPASSTSLLMANVSSVFSSSWELVLVAISIPLAFAIIHYIKGLFPSVRGGKK